MSQKSLNLFDLNVCKKSAPPPNFFVLYRKNREVSDPVIPFAPHGPCPVFGILPILALLHIPGYNGLPPFSADMEENGNEESEERVGPVFV